MIGTRPVADLAPLDYRYGLDAAMPVLAGEDASGSQPLVLCNVPALADEVRQRLPQAMWAGIDHRAAGAHAALWIEPLTATWRMDLETLAGAVRAGGRLVVIASQPLAGLIMERSGPGAPQPWGRGGGLPAGARIGGMRSLVRRLAEAGFHLEARYGLHSLPSMAANVLGRQLERWGRSDLGDRLHFRARLQYCSGGSAFGLLAELSTVALLMASKVAR